MNFFTICYTGGKGILKFIPPKFNHSKISELKQGMLRLYKPQIVWKNTFCLWQESLFIGDCKSVTDAIKAFTVMRLERFQIEL